MKLLIRKVYFKLPEHPDLITHPFFRDYQQQFVKRGGFQADRYLYHVAEDPQTKIYGFPSLLVNYRHILKPKVVMNGVVVRPLLHKITVYPVVRGELELAERFFSKKQAPVVYGYVRGWSAYSLEEFIKLMKKFNRPYAYMYIVTPDEVENILSFGFEMIILDSFRLSKIGADKAYAMIQKMLKIIQK